MSKSAYTLRLGMILGVAILIGAVLFSFPPIAQNPIYYNFADKRSFHGVPNFADVFSNLPFIVVGFLGLRLMKKQWDHGFFFSQPSEKCIWLTFFLGIALVFIDSFSFPLHEGTLFGAGTGLVCLSEAV